MTDELVKRWDEYVESMGSVMGEVEHMAQQMRDRIEQLTAERDRLRAVLSDIKTASVCSGSRHVAASALGLAPTASSN